ncbi:hypothetical protein SAMN04488018_1337 [Myroides marinus]|uniref:TIR domain-containing protein n=1 Tax=Myroides marinus TaxID=703342 RepID=A0A1H6YG58_9FLAO|nr:toll/interleukin-1 receptor domain-containing protein [Myroides marinus]SEJ40231.1 hypothetical protein SAMN04488018_1337 [Myroides marinus]
MYIGFELKYLDFKDFEYFHEIGKSNFIKHKRIVKKTLEEFTNANGSLNGDKMQSAWFPEIKADVFLSHSHADKDLVIAFAGWLKHTFGVTVFIDSCIWGNFKNLQKIIDESYSKNLDGKYIYDKVLYASSHVHMMLNTALMQMIDTCECIIFVNTPYSVKPNEVVAKIVSPWIYSEIGMTKLIRKKELKEYRVQPIFESDRTFSDKLNIEYNLDTDHLTKLSINDLNNWKNNFKRYKTLQETFNAKFTKKEALDYLYELKEVRQR